MSDTPKERAVRRLLNRLAREWSIMLATTLEEYLKEASLLETPEQREIWQDAKTLIHRLDGAFRRLERVVVAPSAEPERYPEHLHGCPSCGVEVWCWESCNQEPFASAVGPRVCVACDFRKRYPRSLSVKS